MGIFFGTDGIRGVFGKTLTIEMAYRCGKALAMQKDNVRILIGKDTRKSSDLLLLFFCAGVVSEGGYIEDLEVCPTAAIGYLTQYYCFDYGIVISASHNSFEYNGIKIFDKFGRKINEQTELEIEKSFFINRNHQNINVGKFISNKKKIKTYENFLLKQSRQLNNLKVVLDCANGAASKIASKVFKKLGAKVITINNKPSGININKNCGALYVENLQKRVLATAADVGFAFDGDSDRIIAIDEKGNIIDGDKLLYIFAKSYIEENKLKNKIVVGTLTTNSAIEKQLNNLGVSLIRTDVGDKFIDKALVENDLILGGEQCGHIFLKDKLSTGDGILNAIMIANILAKNKIKLSECINFKLYQQVYINVKVKNKNKLLNCINYINLTKKTHFNDKFRVIIRPSGTEPVIRIMVEGENYDEVNIYAEKIEKEIIKIAEDL